MLGFSWITYEIAQHTILLIEPTDLCRVRSKHSS